MASTSAGTIPPSLFTVAPTNGTTGGNSTVTTPFPTPAPAELPEGAALNVQTDDWRDVQVTAFTSLAAGAVLLTLFECLRGRRNRGCRSLYRQRHSLRFRKKNVRLKRIAVEPYPRGFLRWIPSTWRVSDAEFYEQVGMDGYVTLRFIKLCKRLCAFAAFFGMVFLLPIYEQGINDSEGASRLSMANLQEGGETLWSGVVFAYLFTLYFLYSLRKEFLAFSDLRNDWLAGGDVARSTQTAYTVRVERIPRAFRSPAILQKFFSTLFPGQIHSATVCLGLTDLRALTLKRAKCLQALERAIIRQEVMILSPQVRPSWFGPKEDAVRYYGLRLAEINQKLRPKQEAKLEAAKNIERFRRKELRNMGASLENMAMYFVDQLARGGAEDEDGNARVSWLERRGGDYAALESHPLQMLQERQQLGESGVGSWRAAPPPGEGGGGGEAAERTAEPPQGGSGRTQQRRRSRASGGGGAQRRRRSGSVEGGSGGGGGGGGDDSYDEEQGGSGSSGGGGGGGGVRPSAALSPVAEEQGRKSQRPTLDSGWFRSSRHGSTGSIGSDGGGGGGRRSFLTGGGDRARAHTTNKDDGLHRASSWRQLVKRRDSHVAEEQQQAVKEAEELINKQGEDLIRFNLDHARQMSNLHQSLGAGALGRSVAAPRVSVLVHPSHRDGNDGWASGDESRSRSGRGGGSLGLPPRLTMFGGTPAGGGRSVSYGRNNSFLFNSRHGFDSDGGDDEDAAAASSGGLGVMRSGSGDALSAGQAAMVTAAAVGAASLDAFGGGGGLGGGGGACDHEGPAARAGGGGGGGGGGDRFDNGSTHGGGGGDAAAAAVPWRRVFQNAPVASPTDSIASSFFSVSSPSRLPPAVAAAAAQGRRWSSAEAGGEGVRVGGDASAGGGGHRGGRRSVSDAVYAAHAGAHGDRRNLGRGGSREGGVGGGGRTRSGRRMVAGGSATGEGGATVPATVVEPVEGEGGEGEEEGGRGGGGRGGGGGARGGGRGRRRRRGSEVEDEDELSDGYNSDRRRRGRGVRMLDEPRRRSLSGTRTAAGGDDRRRGSRSPAPRHRRTRGDSEGRGRGGHPQNAEGRGAETPGGEEQPVREGQEEADDMGDTSDSLMSAKDVGRWPSSDGEKTMEKVAARGEEALNALSPPPAPTAAAGSPPSEAGVLPRSQLPRYIDDEDDDYDDGSNGSGAARSLSETPPTGRGGEAKSKSDVGPSSPSFGASLSDEEGGVDGDNGDHSPNNSRTSHSVSSSGCRSDAALLRHRGGGAAADGDTVRRQEQEGASPARAGSEGVRRRGGSGRTRGRQKGSLTPFPALFSRRSRSPAKTRGSAGTGLENGGGFSSSSPKSPSSFALASPKDRRRISPRSRRPPGAATPSSNDETGGGGGGGGGATKGSRQRSAALATARRRVGGDARWVAATSLESAVSPEKPLMPWDEEWDAVEEMEAGLGGGGGTGSDNGRPAGKWNSGSIPRPPGDTMRDASAAVREGVRQGLMNANSGVTKRAVRTGRKVKRGVNEVKDTVKDTVKDLRRGVGESVSEVADAVKVVTKAGGMSGTGFVTFKCLSGRACAVSTLVTNRPEVFNLTPAPEPRDIVWKNVTNHVIHVQNRNRLVNLGLALGIIFWSVVVSGIQTLSKVDTIAQVFPAVEKAAEENTFLTSLLEAYLPVTILLIIINLLYFILKWMALHLEGYKTYSEVERAVMSRYFFYQLANVFVTIGAGSIKDAIEKILQQPRELLHVLGETVPKVAVYFINLIIVKVVTGLLLELCFGGRSLKFWRILFAETFTDPGLRTNAGKTRGAYEPSEPWYGRFFADFLLIMLIVFTFQVIAPVVAVAGLLYFIFAEIIYKYQLLHCYWPLYESGGLFFHKLFRQLVLGAVAGQVTLIGYMSIRQGLRQWPFLLPLPLVVLYSSSRWRDAGRQTSNMLSLDKAVLQDVQNEINVREGAKPAWESFTPTAYVQPSLLPGDPDVEFDGEVDVGDRRDDSDVDVEGLLDLDSKGNVIVGNHGKSAQLRKAGQVLRRGSSRRRRSSALLYSAFPWLASSPREDAGRPTASSSNRSEYGHEEERESRRPTRTMSSLFRSRSGGIINTSGRNSRPDSSIA